MASHKIFTELITSGSTGATLTVTKARPVKNVTAVSTGGSTYAEYSTVIASSISGQVVTFPGLVASTQYLVSYEGF